MNSKDPQTIDQLVAQLVNTPPPQSNQPYSSSPQTNNPLPGTPPRSLPGMPASASPPSSVQGGVRPQSSLSPTLSQQTKPSQQPQFKPQAQPQVQPPRPPTHEYQSSIRTMESDLALIKSGKSPSGADIQKTFSQQQPSQVKPTPTLPVKEVLLPPTPPAEAQTSAQSKTSGFTSKSGSVDITGKFTGLDKSSPIKEESKLPFAVPKPTYSLFGNKQFLIFGGIFLLLVVGGFYLYFIWNPSLDQVVTKPTPTETPSSAVSPSESPFLAVFDQKFGQSKNILAAKSEQNLATIIKSKVAEDQSSAGQFRAYKLVDENGNTYTFKEFLVGLGINTESLDIDSIFSSDWELVFYDHYDDQAETITRPVIISTVNTATAHELMALWEKEGQFISDMANLLGYKENIYDNPVLVEDSYNNVNFKYLKLPDRNLGVAYAIFLDNYLIIASSRDSFRAALDVLSSSF